MTAPLSVAALAHQIRQHMDQPRSQRPGPTVGGAHNTAAASTADGSTAAALRLAATGGGFDASLMAALGRDNPAFLAESAQLAMAQQLFGNDATDDGADSDIFTSIMQGSMNGLNMQALQTLAKIQATRQPDAADAGGHTVRMDIDRTPLQEIEADILARSLATSEVRLPITTTPLPLELIAPGVSATGLDGLAAEVRLPINRIPFDPDATYVASQNQLVPPLRTTPGPLAAMTAEATPAARAASPALAPQAVAANAAVATSAAITTDAAVATRAAVDTMPAHRTAPARATVPAQARAVAAYAPAKPLPATGILSSRFESGPRGAAAIGFDRRGGTSYGTYQISSRRGSMDRFLNFLDKREPEWAERLRAAGPLDTGSRAGAAPDVWRQLASEKPARFARLQDEFIHRANYRPALQNILEQTNINVGNHSPALREVLWSTAVQHGARGATEIFTNATQAVADSGGNFEKSLIEAVYKERSDWFSRSSHRIRQAVQSRLDNEKGLALSLLAKVHKAI